MPDPMLVLHPAVLVLDPVMLVLPPEDFNLFGFLRDDFKILISPLSKQTSPWLRSQSHVNDSKAIGLSPSACRWTHGLININVSLTINVVNHSKPFILIIIIIILTINVCQSRCSCGLISVIALPAAK